MEGPPELGAAIAALVALRAEHRPIVEKIVGDPGMDPSTRLALMAHLLEEEDERLQAIARAAGGAGTGAAAGVQSGVLTVGSLRGVREG